jgi:hypothetical protein
LNWEVLCVDCFHTGSKENIRKLASHPNFELVRHDICQPLSAEVDLVLNFACPASPVATIDPSSQVSTDSAEPVTFFTWANVDALPINEFFDGDPGPPLFRDAAEGVQVTAVNGVPATLFKSVTGFDTVDVLVIPSGRNYIQFSFTRGSQAMLAALATITVAP